MTGAYLFAYFIGNEPEEEQLFYGISYDGFHFKKLSDTPIIQLSIGKRAIRDPFVFRGEDGAFYIVATDMKSSEGWASQSTIVIYKTEDLIHISDAVLLDYKNFDGWEDCNRAWAPQAIWCPEKESYMIYLALQKESTMETGGITMFRQYTKDLMDLSAYTQPEIMLEYKEVDGCAIDGDIIYDSVNERYIMYYSGRKISESKSLCDKFTVTKEQVPFRTAQGEDMLVEGSNIYQLKGEQRWIIAADGTLFNGNRYAMAETTDFKNYRELSSEEFSFDFTPRHGYVIQITQEEVERLLQHVWGTI